MNKENSGLIRAHFKGSTPEDFADFSRSECLLPISVGQIYHEDEKLAALINLVNAKFKSCLIVVCDSLYRHTLQVEGYSASEAYHIAIKAGENWLQANKEIYTRLTIPAKLTRWDYWICNHNKEYKKYYKAIDYLYRSDPDFQAAFRYSIDEFLMRYSKKKNFNDEGHEKAFPFCFKYLVEECAAISVIWKQTRYQYIIYPSRPVPAITLTLEHFVNTQTRKKVGWLRPLFSEYSLLNMELHLEAAGEDKLREIDLI